MAKDMKRGNINPGKEKTTERSATDRHSLTSIMDWMLTSSLKYTNPYLGTHNTTQNNKHIDSIPVSNAKYIYIYISNEYSYNGCANKQSPSLHPHTFTQVNWQIQTILFKKIKDSITVCELLLMLHKCLTEQYNTHVHSCSFWWSLLIH